MELRLIHERVLFVVIGCSVLIKGPTVSSACPVVLSPSSVVVEYGDSFSVDCNSTKDQIEGLGWESTYKGTGLIEDVHVQLQVDRVDRWTIMSQCYLNFEDGSQCTKNLPITVYKKPDCVSILSPNAKEPMVEHGEYELQCEVENVAPVNKVIVTWYKDDKRVQHETLSAEPVATPQNRSSFYKLKAHQSDNGAKLLCEAKFDFGPLGPNVQPLWSPTTTLRVLYPPFFKNTKVETVEAPVDQNITLDCTASGNPLPQYHWQVPDPTKQRAEGGPILSLAGPIPGTYNCTASNTQGSAFTQFVVTEAPRGPPGTTAGDYTVLAALVGIIAALGVLLLISGPFIVTKDGTFSLNKCSKGQPSKPI